MEDNRNLLWFKSAHYLVQDGTQTLQNRKILLWKASNTMIYDDINCNKMYQDFIIDYLGNGRDLDINWEKAGFEELIPYNQNGFCVLNRMEIVKSQSGIARN